MPDTLTAAELAQIEARLKDYAIKCRGFAAWAKQEDRDLAYEALGLIEQNAIKDVPRLLAAVREARALVEGLALGNPSDHNHLEGSKCVWCRAGIYTENHAPDCAWDAARRAKAAWGEEEFD